MNQTPTEQSIKTLTAGASKDDAISLLMAAPLYYFIFKYFHNRHTSEHNNIAPTCTAELMTYCLQLQSFTFITAA